MTISKRFTTGRYLFAFGLLPLMAVSSWAQTYAISSVANIKSGPMVVDGNGNLYLAYESGSIGVLSNIIEVTSGGAISTFASTTASQSNPGFTALAMNSSGSLFALVGGPSSGLYQVINNGTLQAVTRMASGPSLAIDSAGNYYFSNGQAVQELTPTGVLTSITSNGTCTTLGDGGPASNACIPSVGGIAVDAAGNLYISDVNNNSIRKVSAATGTITTVAGSGASGYSGDGGPATQATLNTPAGVVVDAAGNIYIADSGNFRVRKVSTNGLITTIAGTGGNGSSGDGGPAISAQLTPGPLAISSTGVLYVGDANKTTRTLTPSAPPANQPTITPGGIVPIDSSRTTIQPGEWISIFGTNLGDSTATWGRLPDTLGGTSVTIDGKSAYLWFVSPTQINLQVPDDNAQGIVPVVVTTPNGTTTSTVTLDQWAPSFSLRDNRHVSGIILRHDGSGYFGNGSYDVLGPQGNPFGYPTVPAKAGDIIELYAFGFGPTNPQIPAGQLFSGAAPTTTPVNFLINNVNVTASFVGLSSAGQYQINLTVPEGLGIGDVPLTALVGGVQSQTGTVISLQ